MASLKVIAFAAAASEALRAARGSLTSGKKPSGLSGPLTGLAEAHVARRPETHVALFAVTFETEVPRPRADLLDLQIQVPAIGMQAGFFSSRCTESAVSLLIVRIVSAYLLNLRSYPRLRVRSDDIWWKQRETSNARKRLAIGRLRGHFAIC